MLMAKTLRILAGNQTSKLKTMKKTKRLKQGTATSLGLNY